MSQKTLDSAQCWHNIAQCDTQQRQKHLSFVLFTNDRATVLTIEDLNYSNCQRESAKEHRMHKVSNIKPQPFLSPLVRTAETDFTEKKTKVKAVLESHLHLVINDKKKKKDIPVCKIFLFKCYPLIILCPKVTSANSAPLNSATVVSTVAAS